LALFASGPRFILQNFSAVPQPLTLHKPHTKTRILGLYYVEPSVCFGGSLLVTSFIGCSSGIPVPLGDNTRRSYVLHVLLSTQTSVQFPGIYIKPCVASEPRDQSTLLDDWLSPAGTYDQIHSAFMALMASLSCGNVASEP
jgi:hypothetical protein